MSDLLVLLVLIGVVFVGGVMLFNWQQERRFRKQADAAFQTPVGDPLAPGDAPPVPRGAPARIEPGLQEPAFDTGHDAPGAVAEPHLDAEPMPQPPVPPAGESAHAVADAPRGGQTAAPPAPYDELIEYRVRIGGDAMPSGLFADAFNQTRALGKPVRWSGLPVGGGAWETLQPWREARYQQLVVTLQLADRNGSVQEEQLAALCSLLQALSESHGLRVVCDEADDAMERAQAIDRFCVDVDVLIGLNVVARGDGTVDLARIVREAEDRGMVLGVDGVFQLLDSRGEPLYALCNHDAEPFSPEGVEGQTSQGVTLQFDVPRVPDGLKVFDSMVAFGRKLANDVGGLLVDDNLRPLTDSGIEKIRSQLVQIYERMEARGVPSGSRRALRLFS
ncbi:MAG: cell division protein ZipA C-terminal FtsZ-binding domain-containing protein [Gammaproteobacteria bacterium]